MLTEVSAIFVNMFTREQASRITKEFWTTFGKYMKPILSSEGLKINWVNYHTGVKYIYFRMDAGPTFATIYISIEHQDPEIQQLYFEQFAEFESILHAALMEEWDWQLHASLPDGRITTRIHKGISGVSLFNRDQWPDLISFFKPRIIALDSFWENAKYSFDVLK